LHLFLQGLLLSHVPNQVEIPLRCGASVARGRLGYSRDKRSDCVQVVIALIVTPEGFPLAYEVLPGNTADSATLREVAPGRRGDRRRPAIRCVGDNPKSCVAVTADSRRE